MKVGTLSLNVNTIDLNYGAMLHSWAFQKYLDKNKIDNEIINYVTPSLYGENLKYPFILHFKNKKIKSGIVSLIRLHSHTSRFEKFERFKHNHLRLTKTLYSQEMLSKTILPYDNLICESDVIWDPNFFGGNFDATFFLALDSMKYCKKTAYAASAANLAFDEKQKENFSKLILNLDNLSCRETYTAKYTEEIIGRNVPCVVDPVLLLKAEDYDVIMKQRIIAQPYLLLYTPVGYDYKLIHLARKYAKKNNLEMVELSSYPWDCAFGKTISDAGVEDFLSLIKYATVVFTNSFHAVCFSIIFHKEFYAFARETGRKIQDICERIGLGERYNPNILDEHAPIDYQIVDKVVGLLVEESIKYLKSSLYDEKCLVKQC